MAIDKRFDVYFLDEARKFLLELSNAEKEEILADIQASTRVINTTLFKKLNKDIWEFRSKYNGRQFRMLAFWDNLNHLIEIVRFRDAEVIVIVGRFFVVAVAQ